MDRYVDRSWDIVYCIGPISVLPDRLVREYTLISRKVGTVMSGFRTYMIMQVDKRVRREEEKLHAHVTISETCSS